jgi:hypothetical protein
VQSGDEAGEGRAGERTWPSTPRKLRRAYRKARQEIRRCDRMRGRSSGHAAEPWKAGSVLSKNEAQMTENPVAACAAPGVKPSECYLAYRRGRRQESQSRWPHLPCGDPGPCVARRIPTGCRPPSPASPPPDRDLHLVAPALPSKSFKPSDAGRPRPYPQPTTPS